MAHYTGQDLHLENWTWPRREDAGFLGLQVCDAASLLPINSLTVI